MQGQIDIGRVWTAVLAVHSRTVWRVGRGGGERRTILAWRKELGCSRNWFYTHLHTHAQNKTSWLRDMMQMNRIWTWVSEEGGVWLAEGGVWVGSVIKVWLSTLAQVDCDTIFFFVQSVGELWSDTLVWCLHWAYSQTVLLRWVGGGTYCFWTETMHKTFLKV